MTRSALYSRSRRLSGRRDATQPGAAELTPPPKPPSKLRLWARRFERPLLIASGLMVALVAFGIYTVAGPQPQKLTQKDIDAAVLHTLKTKAPDPFHAAVATDVIRPSVVLVKRLGKEKDEEGKTTDKSTPPDPKPVAPAKKGNADPKASPGAEANNGKAGGDKDSANKSGDQFADKGGDKGNGSGSGTDKDKDGDKQGGERERSTRGLGTGVVIADDGLIITCLHVIAGAERIGLVFADGSESEAEVVSVQPENDLAVLKAKTVPDDLQPATLRSTKGLKVGDEVVAVGFPFGIGPSTTYGVVSGLRREHHSQEGQRNLVDLIQVDAAANPGNSGGPLVTAEGDVVGIVTSILNPTDKGFFVGIAFAVPIENAATAAGLSPF